MLCFDFDTMCKINAFPIQHYYFYCVKFGENQGQSKISDVKRRVVIGNMVAPGIQRVTSLRPMRCDVVCGAWCMPVNAWTMDSNRKDMTWTFRHLKSIYQTCGHQPNIRNFSGFQTDNYYVMSNPIFLCPKYDINHYHEKLM